MTSKPDYRDSHTAQGYGKDYHKSFSTHAYRRYIWGLEQGILRSILEKHANGNIKKHLDFACGTGRVFAFLAKFAEDSTGVDISDSMLEIAKSENSSAKLISGDITRADLLKGQKYDLITAFRFFLRAQPSLRDEVMTKLVDHLENDGHIVFNIHNNKSSISNNVSKLYTKIKYGKVSDRDEMSFSEVASFVQQHGLTIVDTSAYGTFPVFREDQRFPEKIISCIDKITKNKYLSTYVIYVCRKNQNA